MTRRPVWLSWALLAALGLVMYLRRGPHGPAQSDKVTVLLSAYRTDGLRPRWIRQTAQLYSSSDFDHLVDRIILVWNEPTAPPPKMPKGVKVLKGDVNSMNNRPARRLARGASKLLTDHQLHRWIITRPWIRTTAVLVLDDDISVSLVRLALPSLDAR